MPHHQELLFPVGHPAHEEQIIRQMLQQQQYRQWVQQSDIPQQMIVIPNTMQNVNLLFIPEVILWLFLVVWCFIAEK